MIAPVRACGRRPPLRDAQPRRVRKAELAARVTSGRADYGARLHLLEAEERRAGGEQVEAGGVSISGAARERAIEVAEERRLRSTRRERGRGS